MEKIKLPTALQQTIRDRRAVKKGYSDKPVTEETIKKNCWKMQSGHPHMVFVSHGGLYSLARSKRKALLTKLPPRTQRNGRKIAERISVSQMHF